MKNKEIEIKLKVVQKNEKPQLSDFYSGSEFKNKLEDIILSMQNNMLYGAMGISPPKSFLFYGPPGTGKTMAVNVIANSLAEISPENSVILMPYNIGQYGTAYINQGSVMMQQFFNIGEQIAQQPEVSNVIYWIDECETLMSSRGGSQTHKEDDKLLNTLMTNLQSINDRGTNEFIFFATNFPNALDKASIRSGRVNYKLSFELPNNESRYKIIQGVIDKRNDAAKYQIFRKYDIDNLVGISKNFSNADINSAIEESISTKIKTELRQKPISNKIIPAYYITQKGLEIAFETIKKQNNINENKNRRIGFL